MASDCHIVCFGNELHGDDGFGPAVHARLAGMRLPPGVRLFRADTAGCAALALLEDCARAVLVDAVSGFGEPGSLHNLPPEAITVESGGNGHGFGVGGLLALATAVLPRLPQINLVGVEAAEIRAFAPGLSAKVATSLPAAVDLIVKTIEHEFTRDA